MHNAAAGLTSAAATHTEGVVNLRMLSYHDAGCNQYVVMAYSLPTGIGSHCGHLRIKDGTLSG